MLYVRVRKIAERLSTNGLQLVICPYDNNKDVGIRIAFPEVIDRSMVREHLDPVLLPERGDDCQRIRTAMRALKESNGLEPLRQIAVDFECLPEALASPTGGMTF